MNLREEITTQILLELESLDEVPPDYTPNEANLFDDLVCRINPDKEIGDEFDELYAEIIESEWYDQAVRERQYELWCEDMNEEYERREYATEKGKIARKYG